MTGASRRAPMSVSGIAASDRLVGERWSRNAKHFGGPLVLDMLIGARQPERSRETTIRFGSMPREASRMKNAPPSNEGGAELLGRWRFHEACSMERGREGHLGQVRAPYRVQSRPIRRDNPSLAPEAPVSSETATSGRDRHLAERNIRRRPAGRQGCRRTKWTFR